jgi:hypothetical protein
MINNDILKKQAKLFNILLNKEQIDYILKNNIMIYSNISDVINENVTEINCKNIIWTYDDNNYRIPYYNEKKINQIKLQDFYNIYDFISSASLILEDDIICGENFLKICDVFIGSHNSINSNPNNKYLQKNIYNIDNNLTEILKIYKTIFIKTDDLYNFYNKTKNDDLSDKIIITHNSDHEIDIKYNPFLNNIKKQYSQNCITQHKNLESIPIGIENSQWFDHKILHEIRSRTDIKKEKNIYFMFSLSTHKSRNMCYKILKNKLKWNKKLSKKDYFIELKKHKYAICPRGNGLDTHRIWECLYLDVIPIMLKHDSIKIDNLPIIYLNNWKEINEVNLNKRFENMNFSKITFDYYKKNII